MVGTRHHDGVRQGTGGARAGHGPPGDREGKWKWRVLLRAGQSQASVMTVAGRLKEDVEAGEEEGGEVGPETVWELGRKEFRYADGIKLVVYDKAQEA